MNKWNLKNALGMLIYLLLYVIGTILVCMTGIIHPVFFVCYQITAGIVLTVIVIKAFDQLKTFGVVDDDLCLFQTFHRLEGDEAAISRPRPH